jgi:Cdc6-like AAA superfamily ATPase
MANKMANKEYRQLAFDAGSVFTPGSPTNERDLFAGRLDQVHKIIGAISQRGYHAVLYGERGVGKTSLASVLSGFLHDTGRSFLLPRVNCDSSDTFSSLWRKAFREIVVTKSRPEVLQEVMDSLPPEITPEHIRRTLTALSRGFVLVVIFDEFHRIATEKIATGMADTLKTLSDYAVPVTILLIGVADSVEQLIKEHHSVERSLVQIPMPRMSSDEIAEIVTNGLAKLNMEIDGETLDEVTSLSQGLPYVTHMLALYASRAALHDESKKITDGHFHSGIQQALEQWQQSIKSAYYAATTSQQPDTIYKEVLLACALADVDELGYFSAAAVRTPLKMITSEDYDIPNFAKHLKEFSDQRRGMILQRVGEKRRLRYRFVSPLLRAYIIVRHFHDGTLTVDLIRQIRSA